MRVAIGALAVRSTAHGVGRYVTNLAAAMAREFQDWELVVFATRANRTVIAAALVASPNVRIVVARPPRFLRPAWEQVVLPYRLRALRIDVYLGPVFVVPMAKVCPQVVVVHDLTFFRTPDVHSTIKRTYFRAAIPLSLHRADGVIGVSESTSRDIRSQFPWAAHKLATITEGVDRALFRPMPDQEARAIAKRIGIVPPFIFSLGVLEPRKNLERLIAAFGRIRNTDEYRGQLVIAGSERLGWGQGGLADVANRAGVGEQVRFVGQIDDATAVALMNLCDVFAYVPLYEGFGLPVLEALACGARVVTSNVSSLPEVAGDSAQYVDPEDVDSIARGLLTELNNTGSEITRVSRATARAARFSWDDAARKTGLLLGRVANRRS